MLRILKRVEAYVRAHLFRPLSLTANINSESPRVGHVGTYPTARLYLHINPPPPTRKFQPPFMRILHTCSAHQPPQSTSTCVAPIAPLHLFYVISSFLATAPPRKQSRVPPPLRGPSTSAQLLTTACIPRFMSSVRVLHPTSSHVLRDSPCPSNKTTARTSFYPQQSPPAGRSAESSRLPRGFPASKEPPPIPRTPAAGNIAPMWGPRARSGVGCPPARVWRKDVSHKVM